MKALLLVLLLSFEPSPAAAAHACWAWQRGMVPIELVTLEGYVVLGEVLGIPEDVSCEVLWDRVTGDGWAVAGCDDAAPLCAFCIWAESASGARSECGTVAGYVEDLP